MDHSRAPVLDALADYHRPDRYGFSPPGHRQGKGADERVLAVLGRDPFRDDVLASGGLDDWRSTGGYLSEQITPYPPGVPAVVPGELLNHAVIDYLRSGLAAGMPLPDAADSRLEHFRVVAL